MSVLNELQDFIDTPQETLTVEYKRWLNLDDQIVKAKLAQHIAALANHGGGYIVFGINDDMTPDGDRPISLDMYNHDAIMGIVQKYLMPAVHADVHLVTSTKSLLQYPIIRVPSHGAVPICAKANGPDDKGKTQGVVKGTYYIRSAGPSSTPIIGYDLWQPLIHRCVIAERESLLKNLSLLLSGQRLDAPTKVQELTLDKWREESKNAFIRYIVEKTSGNEWPVPINVNHYQFSYRILQDEESKIPTTDIISVLQKVNNEVKNVVWTGWSMFYPFTNEEIKPYIVVQTFDEQELELYETNLLRKKTAPLIGLPDFWQIIPTGWGTMIRVYREDRDRNSTTDGFLSPRLLAQEVTELLVHTSVMAKQFPSAHSIEIRCTWKGLNNRVIADFNPGVYWGSRTSKTDIRNTAGVWSIPEINGSLPLIVSELINPVLRLFDQLEVTPEWIEKLIPSFRSLSD